MGHPGTQLTRPNGVNTNYSYDSMSHLLSVLHQAEANTLDGASYTYDPAGNRTSKTNYLDGVTSNYGYDLLYQLTQVTQGASTTESYSYDAVGNRLSSLGVPTYNYSSNELTSNSNGGYTYDNNGNTLTDAQGRSFTWDFENRLIQAVVSGENRGTTILGTILSGGGFGNPARWAPQITSIVARISWKRLIRPAI
jgi:YD repeat-containing protein